jgi:hypothetical protein
MVYPLAAPNQHFVPISCLPPACYTPHSAHVNISQQLSMESACQFKSSDQLSNQFAFLHDTPLACQLRLFCGLPGYALISQRSELKDARAVCAIPRRELTLT